MTMSDDEAAKFEKSFAIAPGEKYYLTAFALCMGGALLVLFSSALGAVMVRHYSPDGNGYSWSHDDANQAAEILRWIGGMLFAAGLVERIVGALNARPIE